jgi:hypothetical protein
MDLRIRRGGREEDKLLNVRLNSDEAKVEKSSSMMFEKVTMRLQMSK